MTSTITPKRFIYLSLLLSLGASSAHAQDWLTPSVCASGVTGNEEDEPPVVEFYSGPSPHNQTLQDGSLISAPYFSKGVGYVDVTVQNAFNSLYLTVSYTPFLGGYSTFFVRGNGRWTVQLPSAGFVNTPQQKTYETVTFTISNSGTPMPFASVMITPDFVGSSPYTMQADSNGQIVVNCFQSFPTGNSIYIVSQDGQVALEGQLTINTSETLGANTNSRGGNIRGTGTGQVVPAE